MGDDQGVCGAPAIRAVRCSDCLSGTGSGSSHNKSYGVCGKALLVWDLATPVSRH